MNPTLQQSGTLGWGRWGSWELPPMETCTVQLELSLLVRLGLVHTFRLQPDGWNNADVIKVGSGREVTPFPVDEACARLQACAHRWKNVFYSRKDAQNNKLPNGLCYRFSSDLTAAHPIIPCYRDHQWKFGEDYGSCQAGMSNFLMEDLIVMGAPGTSYWTGSVLAFNTSGRVMSAYLDDQSGAVTFGSYLGYSVGAGHFLSSSSVEVVGGAPQYNQRGKVFVFSVDGVMLRVVSDVSGQELGAYFGASVCVVDLNADGLSDLLVGAPMTSGASREEGRVHVYINRGQAELQEAEFTLSGSAALAARFGETLADLGDLDDDGYPEVAVGAPQEDDLHGAVYIYNGRPDGVAATPSQRISGSSLGRDLRMFGQSLSSGVDVDGNGYQDVAVGAFLSDSAVVLRTRPVVQLKATLALPGRIDQRGALCRDQRGPTVCFNVTVCFGVTSRRFRGTIELQYNLTSDLLHKPTFPHRFYFSGNGSSNSTKGLVKARHGALVCAAHVAYQRRDVSDVYSPVHFEVSFALRDRNTRRPSTSTLPPLRPILQRGAGRHNTIRNQTQFARSCSHINCSTDLRLSTRLELPHGRTFFALGSGQTVTLKTLLSNSGDDAFLPRLALRLPSSIHYIKVLQNDDYTANCDITEELSASDVNVDCSISSTVLRARSQLNISFLLDVNHNSTPGDAVILVRASSDLYEKEEYLHDNSVRLVLPLKYGVHVNIHGFVSPSSFVFGDEDERPAECYHRRFNYTYQVLNSGPSRSLDTQVVVSLPKTLAPHRHRLLTVLDWKVSRGECWVSNRTVEVLEDCSVPQASFIRQLFFFFSATSIRRMVCGRLDELCEQVVCRLGNLEAGGDASIQLEVGLNPAVLLQAPGRHGVMMLESTALMTSPAGPRTVLLQDHTWTQVAVEAVFTQKPTLAVKTFIIVVSLALGLVILAALIWCLWKAGFFKRTYRQQDRDSWDYVPKDNPRESTT